jgi:hypothetical protein
MLWKWSKADYVVASISAFALLSVFAIISLVWPNKSGLNFFGALIPLAVPTIVFLNRLIMKRD